MKWWGPLVGSLVFSRWQCSFQGKKTMQIAPSKKSEENERDLVIENNRWSGKGKKEK